MQLVAHDLAGTLHLAGGRLEIGHQAQRDGVRLGHYARCSGAPLMVDDGLSRVHALVIQLDERLLVIDTASTNGLRPAGSDDDARILELTPGSELELGDATRLRWTWAS